MGCYCRGSYYYTEQAFVLLFLAAGALKAMIVALLLNLQEHHMNLVSFSLRHVFLQDWKNLIGIQNYNIFQFKMFFFLFLFLKRYFIFSFAGCLLEFLKTDEGKRLKVNKLIDMSAQVGNFEF